MASVGVTVAGPWGDIALAVSVFIASALVLGGGCAALAASRPLLCAALLAIGATGLATVKTMVDQARTHTATVER